MLAFAVGMTSAFAQREIMVKKTDLKQAKLARTRVAAAGKERVAEEATAEAYAPISRSVVINRDTEVEGAQVIMTKYDLQSNSMVANRMYQLPTGEVGVVSTMQPKNATTKRGTGYNFFDGSDWGEIPAERVEDVRTGWPSIAQWGETGEIFVCHDGAEGGGILYYTREVAGEGEWESRGYITPRLPEDFPAAETNAVTWPRIVTSGDNHNIIHVVVCVQDDDTPADTYLFYYRSEDGENWTCTWEPFTEEDRYQKFSADDYSMAAVDHTVAILCAGSFDYHVVMYKSEDDGLTWKRTLVWEDPGLSIDWFNDTTIVFPDTICRPMFGALCLDNKGTAHVAMNCLMTFYRESYLEDTSVYYSIGRMGDGLVYWNEKTGPVQSYNGDPKRAFQLWWVTDFNEEDSSATIQMHIEDSTKWIAFMPEWNGTDYDSDKLYLYDDHYNDYIQRFYGLLGQMALSCDAQGNLACAFCSPDTKRVSEDIGYYYRSVYVNYRNVDDEYWNLVFHDISGEPIVSEEEAPAVEALFTNSIPLTNADGEFWFSYQYDLEIGLFEAQNNSTSITGAQTQRSENYIEVVKIIADPELVSVPETTEPKDVIYSIYPNPATDNNIYVKSASMKDVDASIRIVNLVGQTVAKFNQRLSTGSNRLDIQDLKSGVYFCTISANGFDKTVKFVVK